MNQVPLRLPAELHQDLKIAAKAYDMSLNQYCLYLLTRNCAQDGAIKQKRAEQTLRFIAEAHALQHEINRRRPHPPSDAPSKTPSQRYRELYESTR